MSASVRGFLLATISVLVVGTVWWVHHAELHRHAKLFVRVFGGLAFLASSIPKFRDLDAFVELVHDYRLTPRPVSRLLGRAVPVLEAGAGILLLAGTGRGLTIGAWTAALLMAVFTAAITINLARGRRYISCGCFGESPDERLTPGHAVRNGAMLCAFLWLAGAGPGFALPGTPWASGPAVEASLAALTFLLAAAGVLVLRLSGEVAALTGGSSDAADTDAGGAFPR